MKQVWHYLWNIRNQFDFKLRELLRWNRKGLKFENQNKYDLFDYLNGIEKQKAEALKSKLVRKYHLEEFHENSTKINFRENLFYLQMIETAFDRAEVELPGILTTADIGPAHWFYVQALFAGLTWYGSNFKRSVDLTGFEIDAFRVFGNLYSRYDYAHAHIRDLPVTYKAEAFGSEPEKYDLITLFFPFVFEKDHREWGLPQSEFSPYALRQKVKSSLKPGGLVLVVNQGVDEHEQEKEHLSSLGLTILTAFEMDDLLYKYELKRYVMVAQK